jgi:hypothetical protein
MNAVLAPLTHWSDAYLGLPYVEGEFDCADLAARVRREVFGQEIHLPSDHGAGAFARNAAVTRNKDATAERTDAPVDGDAVLLIARGRLQHIGLYCVIAGEPWVMHNQEKIGVHRTRLRELERFGYRLEGFYKWI